MTDFNQFQCSLQSVDLNRKSGSDLIVIKEEVVQKDSFLIYILCNSIEV